MELLAGLREGFSLMARGRARWRVPDGARAVFGRIVRIDLRSLAVCSGRIPG